MVNRFGILLMVMSAMSLTSCGSRENIYGIWTQPVPGIPDAVQGFVLEKNGNASSINMATLSYEKWEQDGTSLILSGKSIGNGQTILFSDTMEVERLTPDSLFLRKGNLVLQYARKLGNGKESKMSDDSTPAMQQEHKTITGELVIGPEVRTFRPDGCSDTYWVVDETGELYKEYDKVTGGIKNGVPVTAELEVEDAGKAEDGFAKSYKGLYKVYKINRINGIK